MNDSRLRAMAEAVIFQQVSGEAGDFSGNLLANSARLRWGVSMKRLIALVFCVVAPVVSAGNPYRVEIDTTQTPEHAKWAEGASRVGTDWFPRIVNLIGSPVVPAAPVVVKVTVSKDYKGVALTQGKYEATIFEKHGGEPLDTLWDAFRAERAGRPESR